MGVWTHVTVSAINSTQYNDTTTGLVSLANNKYTNRWIYLTVDGEVFAIFDTAEYATLNDSQEAGVPALIPPVL